MKSKDCIISIIACCMLLSSCGSFGEGLLAGLTCMTGSGGNGGMGGYATSVYSGGGGNMDYLLNPNYAVAQVAAQQQQYNQVYNAIAAKTINEVNAKEEQEYQEFCRSGFKKFDGTNYTKQEWRALVGQSIQDAKNGTSTRVSGNSSRSTGTVSSSTRVCRKWSASDLAHCNGNGKCPKCNGDKKYYDASFGIPHWVDPCVICNGSGKCPSCRGTGRLQ